MASGAYQGCPRVALATAAAYRRRHGRTGRSDRTRRDGPVELDFPFRGRWLVQNSPDRRVPSHGTHLFGTTYAIDFVPVDERGRSAPRTWRSLVSVEHQDLRRLRAAGPRAGGRHRRRGPRRGAGPRGTALAAGAPGLCADPGWARASRSDRDRREPRRHRARLHRALRPARAPAERQRLRPARRRGQGRRRRGHLWQLRQQHRAARSCPGHGLDRLGDDQGLPIVFRAPSGRVWLPRRGRGRRRLSSQPRRETACSVRRASSAAYGIRSWSALPQRAPAAVRPHLRRRVHGAEPLVGDEPPRRRPRHGGRHRDDHPDRRRQHDRHRGATDGRDGGATRRPHRRPAGHPCRSRQRGHRLGQGATSSTTRRSRSTRT